MQLSVADIISLTGGRLGNEAELGTRVSEIKVERPSALGISRPNEISFFFNKEYQQELMSAQAGILITAEPFVAPLKASGLPLVKRAALVVCRDPYLAMAVVTEKFGDTVSTAAHVKPAQSASIHPSAVISREAELGKNVAIGANCVIEAGAKIGDGTVLYPGCYIGAGVRIGKSSVLFPNVTAYEQTVIGDRVRIHAGVVLGADGFGYAAKRSEDGKVVGHQKIYHFGHVVIGDDVEIGANACVDRATFGETIIENEAKLDNHVHVGHNARVGRGAIICGGTCLAGRASIGRFAYVGGLAGIANQILVGDASNVCAMTLVTKDVPEGGTVVGNPQRDHKEHFRAHAMLNRMIAKPARDRAGDKDK
jgi:UDP-3-O-[3-hydroxymyristoyl] glucosamine N-acyltransferase